MPIITAQVEYVAGHLRYGHYEVDVTDTELENFKELPRDIQEEFIKDNGEFLLDDYSIEDMGDIYEIEY